MKRLIIVFLILLNAASGQAQTADTLPGNWQLAARFQFGFVIAHRPTVHHLQQKHAKGLEVEYIKPFKGDDDWQQPFLIPAYSIAYQYINLGSEDFLGSGHALTARMLFPLNSGRMIHTAISAGTGLGYIENKYDRYNNYKNVAIGSHLNAMVSFSFRAAVKTSRLSSADVGLSFTHFSNGSIKPPNLGINIPALQVGYNHFFGKPLRREIREVPPIEKKPINKLFVAGGIKGVDLAKGLTMYGVTGITFMRSYILSYKSTIGAGIDAYYDRSLYRKLENLKKEKVAESTSYRSGLFAGYGFTAGKILMLFQNGIYIVDNYKEDGFLYTRVGVEYLFTSDFTVGFHLKSHFAKADFFEYGIGYNF